MSIGSLKVVATPIGNLQDITLRALAALKEADFVLCEDTRVSKKLLDHYQITTPTISYHQHSGDMKVDKIIALLEEEKNLALVTDAGTPGISDPGSQLVAAVRGRLGHQAKIESIPGVSALTAALSISGNGFDRFLFLGFLPHKKGRQTMLQEIMDSAYPVVLYESKHRIVKLLEELIKKSAATNQTIEVSVARELTKLHESFYHGGPDSVLKELVASPHNLKGEFVVCINKKGKS